MRKIFFHLKLTLFFASVFITACQKESNQTPNEKESPSVTRPDNSGGCRMTMYYYYDAIHDHTQVDRYTYKNGLADEHVTSYGWVAKMDYDVAGRMKGARMYDGNELIYTIQFIYKGEKIIKEIWYLGNTDIVDDEVINTYNQKGQILKDESLGYDYYCVYTYSPDGGIKGFSHYIGGVLFIKGEYTTNQRYKNPYRSIPGHEYEFAYSNWGVFASPWWYSSEKWTFYDENGNPADVLYDLDPARTVWTPAQQNYPQQADFTDAITGGKVLNSFTFENCGGSESPNTATQENTISSNRNSVGESIKSVLYGPKKGLAERIKAFRNKMRNSH